MNLEGQESRCIVVGAGYVGLATAAALAKGWDGAVIVTDKNVGRLEEHRFAIERRENPLGEPGMGAALLQVRIWDRGFDYHNTVVFVCVGTPATDGTIDCSAVREVVHEALDGGARLVVIRSTVTPSFVLELLRDVRDAGPGATHRVAVAPEFLREGHAVEDAMKPSRIVVGAENDAIGETVYQMLFGHQHLRFGEALTVVRICHTTQAEAALVKLASNGMLSMRAWFADAVASSCEALPGGDSARVLTAIGMDPRIGLQHLQPGLGVGGPCLGKDTMALVNDLPAFEPLHEIALAMDADPITSLVERVRAARPGPGLTLIIGSGFKPESPDWHNSPAVELAIQLAGNGPVYIYDWRLPAAERHRLRIRLEEFSQSDRIPVVLENLDGMREIEVVVVVTRCDQIAEELDASLADGALLVDPYRLLNPTGRGIRDGERRYLGRGFGPR